MNTRKGFTLVELLVVIAILAILATVSVVGYTSFINRANNSVAASELTQIRDYAISVDMVKAEGGDMDGIVDPAEAVKAFENAKVPSATAKTETDTVWYEEIKTGDVVTSYKLVKGSGFATWTLADGKIQ